MANNYVQWSCQHTDTFGGEANYSWVRRGTTFVPADATRRQIVRAVKSTLGLTGIRCHTFDCGDMIELKPIGSCQIVFATICY